MIADEKAQGPFGIFVHGTVKIVADDFFAISADIGRDLVASACWNCVIYGQRYLR